MKSTVSKRPNCVRIGTTHSYIVRTQAGYRDLLKKYKKDWSIDEVQGTYPKKYPAMVILNSCYEGYHYIDVLSIALESIMNTVKKSEETIEK